jgi:L-amino acid N-acyltransferase YncA
MSGFEIRDMTEADGRAVLAIYQEGMDTGQATFQQIAPAWTDFDQGHLAAPRLVAEESIYIGRCSTRHGPESPRSPS